MSSTAHMEIIEGVEVAAPPADGWMPDGQWTRLDPDKVLGVTAIAKGLGRYLLTVTRVQDSGGWEWGAIEGDRTLPGPGMGGVATTLAEAMSAAEAAV